MTSYTIGSGEICPWSSDAYDYISSGNNKRLLVVAPQPLEKFLDPECTDCETLVIHGPKGSGKSALLLTKRMLLKKKAEEGAHLICIPNKPPYVFTSLTDDNCVTFKNWDSVSKYCTIEVWTILWKLIFGSYAIAFSSDDKRNVHETRINPSRTESTRQTRLPERLGKLLLGNSYSDKSDIGCRNANNEIATILQNIIHNERVSADDLRAAYVEFVEPSLSTGENSTLVPIFIFVDAVDELLKPPSDGNGSTDFLTLSKREMIVDATDLPNSNDKKAISILAKDVWSCAQISLISASRSLLHDSNGRVRLIGTVRTEAYTHRHLSKATGQMGKYVHEVRYTEKELATIFHENIKHCEKDLLVKPASSDQIVRFFGDSTHSHHSTHQQEHIFSSILRHTLEEPRDLMVMGGKLYALSPNLRENAVEAAKVVNEATAKILEDYIHYLGEPRNTELEKATYKMIDRNVLSKTQVELIASTVKEESDGELSHPFCYLYSLGLIGTPEKNDYDNVIKQVFQLPARYPKSTEENKHRLVLPDSNVYLVHPVLAEEIRKTRSSIGFGFTTYGAAIIGNDLVWTDDQEIAPLSLRRQIEPSGTATKEFLKLIIQGHEAGYNEEITDQSDRFASLKNPVTFSFVAMILALGKRSHYDNSITIDELTQSATYVSSLISTETSVKKNTEIVLPKIIQQISEYCNDTKLKYPALLSQIKARLIKNNCSTIGISLNSKTSTITFAGITANELHIQGFDGWDKFPNPPAIAKDK